MRLLFGIILGCALTVGGVYLADHMTGSAAARPMVNWDVVAKNVDETHDDGTQRLAAHRRLIFAAAARRKIFTWHPRALQARFLGNRIGTAAIIGHTKSCCITMPGTEHRFRALPLHVAHAAARDPKWRRISA